MDLANLIKHPEKLDRETLYDLRSLLALYPYYQTARLLLLQNLYLLHDPSFNQELRDAALYITDRRVIFNLVEAGHYQLKEQSAKSKEGSNLEVQGAKLKAQSKEDRTLSLIDNFLDSLPADEEEQDKKKKRKPTPADAAIDYVSYLLETESEEEKEEEKNAPQMKGQSLIDDFINNEGKIKLKDEPEYKPEMEGNDTKSEKEGNEGYYTETLAKIYIRQGNYEKALEIIRRLNLNFPKKNSYFADQMRFLEKLILNEHHKQVK